jgi:peptidoglycan/LPS O-acetylase OafA/YrhL
MKHPRWDGLDGLRGGAVLVVVMFHLGVLPGGFLGVDVFFVLSGFLITRLIIGEHRRSGSVSLTRFYRRRALRLYPALLTVSSFCLFTAVVARQGRADVGHDAAISLVYLSNLSPLPSGLLDHTWTLSLEEQFYLLWPALLVLALRRPGRWSFAPALTVVATLLTADVVVGQATAVHTYVRAMGLPLGCGLALARPTTVRAVGRMGWPAAAGLVAVLALPTPGWLTTGWPVSVGALLSAPVVALLISRPQPAFEGRILRWFASRSYGLYLWHFPLLSLTRNHGPASVPVGLRLSLGLVAAVLASEASFRLVETPILRLRDRADRNNRNGRGGTGPNGQVPAMSPTMA